MGPVRVALRYKGYDYHQAGAYFVTSCTERRVHALEDPVVSGIIADVWRSLPGRFPTIALDEFVIMPNHVHFVVWLGEGTPDAVGAALAAAPRQGLGDARIGAGASPAPTAAHDWVVPPPGAVKLTPALGDVVGALKSLATNVYLDWIRRHDPSRRGRFWQRNYYERVIRDEKELNAVRCYIANNPARWQEDRDNLENSRRLPVPESVDDYVADVYYYELPGELP